MTLTVAVTGGIGAGKSTVARLLGARGAVVVDSDQLARDVVAPGTPGLAEIVSAFGSGVLKAAGELDRPALAAVVFVDQDARRRLEAITHPRVREAFRDRVRAAGPDDIVVNDIPLLRDLTAAGSFHLVVGVSAPPEVRVARLVGRGLTEADARVRIAAQIEDRARVGLCDLWWSNAGSADDLEPLVTQFWAGRLTPFRDGVRDGSVAPRGGPALVDPNPGWSLAAARLAARVQVATGGGRVDHVGSTAVAGMPAQDVIDLQLTVADLAAADGLRGALRAAGFPAFPGQWGHTAHGGRTTAMTGPGGATWPRRLHGNADPGQTVDLHVRVRDSPGWRWSLLFPAWLRADPAVAADYLAAKRRAAAGHAEDASAAGYAAAKEPWFAAAYPRGLDWARRSGWTPAAA